MSKPETKIRIPVLNDKFVVAILKVKPTADIWAKNCAERGEELHNGNEVGNHCKA